MNYDERLRLEVRDQVAWNMYREGSNKELLEAANQWQLARDLPPVVGPQDMYNALNSTYPVDLGDDENPMLELGSHVSHTLLGQGYIAKADRLIEAQEKA